MSTGTALERLVRRSADRQADGGLVLTQTSPRVVGVVGPRGEITGRVLGSGQLDFVGYWHGRFLTFDAKSCKGTALPMRSLRRHQVVIVKLAHAAGGIAFFLVEFKASQPEYFCLTWPVLAPWWRDMDYGGRQSIPRAVFEASCPRVALRRGALDLVAAIREVDAA